MAGTMRGYRGVFGRLGAWAALWALLLAVVVTGCERKAKENAEGAEKEAEIGRREQGNGVMGMERPGEPELLRPVG